VKPSNSLAVLASIIIARCDPLDVTRRCAAHAEHAETKTEGEREGRPAVDLGAGSGDPRTARGREGRPAVDLGAGSGDPRTARAVRGREGRPGVDLGAGRETRAHRAKKTAELDTPKPPPRTSPHTTHVQPSTLACTL
jgi:hypothetical protein